jgi:hypothetical protein
MNFQKHCRSFIYTDDFLKKIADNQFKLFYIAGF